MNENLNTKSFFLLLFLFRNHTSLIYHYSYNVGKYVLAFFTHLRLKITLHSDKLSL